ncbi:MAG TPA: hypothetical protein VMW53_01610 [archaeon]|nr:hypothetical protein [archaeon]
MTQKSFIYIGQNFYHDSNTVMSSVYKIKAYGVEYERADWGMISQYLAQGIEIYIRPAHDSEMIIFQDKLINILKEKK